MYCLCILVMTMSISINLMLLLTECPCPTFGANCTSMCECNFANTIACNNVNGSCLCKPGWEGIECNTDVKECSENPSVCAAQNTECHEMPGSFICNCKAGYFEDASGSCTGRYCPMHYYYAYCHNTDMRWPCKFALFATSYFVKIIYDVPVLFTPHSLLRLCIALFGAAEEWLLLDIVWLALFLQFILMHFLKGIVYSKQ